MSKSRKYKVVYNSKYDINSLRYTWLYKDKRSHVEKYTDIVWKETFCDRRDIILILKYYRILNPNKGFNCLIKSKKEVEKFREKIDKDEYSANYYLFRCHYYIPNDQYYIITKIENGVEKEVNYEALKNEVLHREKINKFPEPRHSWKIGRKSAYNWKSMRKCRHQWEIHKNKHCDTYSYEKRNYDFI